MVSLYGQQTYKIESSKSKVEFKIKNAGINVDGSMAGVSGSIVFSPSALDKSSVQVQLSASTLSTGIAGRDSHLKKEEYFNVKTYPTIQFVSKVFKKTATGFLVTGILTIKGKSKEVDIAFTFKEFPNSAQFEGSVEINRLDFGVGSSSWVLSDVAKISLNIWVTK
jgi:polyisoprenoid-binding protein YceI